MKLRAGTILGSLVVAVPTASAGGLFLPGSGAVSTSRAGAAVASTEDGEALSINPAGLAKTHGTTITIAASLIQYSMQFTRRGTYDDIPSEVHAYEGTPFATVENKPKPPLGIGSFQPIPVVAIVSDLGGKVPGLHVAAGLYAPSGYPFRDMSNGYKFNEDTTLPPPPSRYDVLQQESQVLFPSIAASYRILPQLDVGARFSAGRMKSKTTVAVWGTPGNVDEAVSQDSQFTADVADNFVPAFGLGVTYRPTPEIEIGAVYNSAAVLRAKGTAQTIKGLGVDQSRVVGPIPDDMSRCEPGGDFEKQRACISLQLPQNATIGARYKVLDEAGGLRGDVELDVGWENWGKRCDYTSTGQARDPDCTAPGQYLINLDAGLYVNDVFQQPLEVNFNNLGLRDTYSVRLGGSYHLPVGANRVILRGGVGYDSAAARTGWLRANFDGAARLTTTVGGAYRTGRFEVNVGGGFVYEGSPSNPGTCNPTSAQLGCAGNGNTNPLDDRQGPDPTNPLLNPENQFESPYNQGTFESHYVLFMLGVNTWF
ncbi:MAG: OmpP1/FadL family transporter [Kofleriaceae bacterium]